MTASIGRRSYRHARLGASKRPSPERPRHIPTGLSIEGVAQLSVDQEVEAVPHAGNGVVIWRCTLGFEHPLQPAAATIGRNDEADAVVGPVGPERRPDDEMRSLGFKDLGLNLALPHL